MRMILYCFLQMIDMDGLRLDILQQHSLPRTHLSCFRNDWCGSPRVCDLENTQLKASSIGRQGLAREKVKQTGP